MRGMRQPEGRGSRSRAKRGHPAVGGGGRTSWARGARRFVAAALLLGSLVGGTGCEGLFGGVDAQIPTVQLSDSSALLIDPPDIAALAKYFCADVLGQGPCLLLGRPPTKEELQFRFQLVFQLDNPNQIPVPTTEILVGFHAYPAETFGELGGVCTTLCEAGADNCPIPPEGACVHRAQDLDSAEEFLAAAVVGGLVLATEALNGEPVGQHLGLYTIPAGDSLELKVTFLIGVDPMLKLLGHTADGFVRDFVNTGEARLDVPYAVAGRVWFDVPYLGRATVGFGPFGDAEEPLWWHVF